MPRASTAAALEHYQLSEEEVQKGRGDNAMHSPKLIQGAHLEIRLSVFARLPGEPANPDGAASRPSDDPAVALSGGSEEVVINAEILQ
jgi:hypothetical protein